MDSGAVWTNFALLCSVTVFLPNGVYASVFKMKKQIFRLELCSLRRSNRVKYSAQTAKIWTVAGQMGSLLK